jgi:hypothetical protein
MREASTYTGPDMMGYDMRSGSGRYRLRFLKMYEGEKEKEGKKVGGDAKL